MRVAIVHEGSDPQRGGAETSIVEMAEALSRLSVDVTLVDRAAADVRYAAASGSAAVAPGEIRRVRLPAPGLTKLGRLKAFIAGVQNHCREAKYDVVHAVTPIPGADVYQPRGGTFPETIRRTLAITTNSVWRAVKALLRRLNLRQQKLAQLERELLLGPNPPVVACVSEYVRRQIEHDYPRAASRARVIFNGVSPPREPAARGSELAGLVEAGTVNLLFVAHNFRLKGLRELIAALPAVRAQLGDARLIVAGRDNTAPYETQARALRISEAVRFIGGGANLAALYRVCNLLVHPTWYDPCSRVVLEAILHGLPAVTTDYNGAADAVRRFGAGEVISEPADVRALSDAIIRTVSRKTRLAESTCAEAREALSMDRHARELIAVYRSIPPG